MLDRWRFTCPEGHVSIQRRGKKAGDGNHIYCDACLKSYPYAVDRKTGDRVDPNDRSVLIV